MKSTHVSSFKHKMLLLGAITIAFLFVSSATFVPQTQGAAVNDQIDTINQQKDLNELLQLIQNKETITEEQQLKIAYLLMNVLKEIISPEETTETDFAEVLQQQTLQLEQSTITTDDIQQTTTEIMISLQKTLTDEITDDTTPQQQSILFNLLKNLLTKLLSNIINVDAISGEGFLDIIMNLLGLFSSLPSLLLNILGQGATLIIQSFIRIIRAIISMILLFIGGVQLVLLIGGLFFIFLGFASKIGIKAFSIVAAPLFAVMAIMFSLATGSLIGGTSLIINFIIGFLVTFAIPIGLIIGIIYLVTGGDISFNFNFGGNEDGLLYMLASIIASIFNPSTT